MTFMIIGITGSICSGKSSVACLMARLLSTDVIDADEICRKLLEKKNDGWVGLVDEWGDRFLTDRREVDRTKLKEAVFNDIGVRKRLEMILHPLARREIRRVAHDKNVRGQSLVVEVPLLFEAGWQDDFDQTVLVCSTKDICLERMNDRDGVSRVFGEKILAAQMDIEEKARLADFVINNSGSWFRTIMQVRRLKKNKKIV